MPPAKVDSDPELLRFQQDLEVQRRSRYTVKHYRQAVARFHRWLQKERGPRTGLANATGADLKQYQIVLTTQGNYAKNTLYATVKALHAFYRFLQSPAGEALKAPRRAQALPKYLSESEASRLREAAKEPRSRAIVSLLLYTGLRVGELCRVTLDSLDFQEQTLRVKSGKGDKDRLVIVAPKALEDVRAYLPTRRKAAVDYLFPSAKGRGPIAERTIQRLVRAAARTAQISKPVTPHVLRHTLATTLLRKGGDIRFIQRILGHASIATTQVYTHLDDAELRRMYDLARPEF